MSRGVKWLGLEKGSLLRDRTEHFKRRDTVSLHKMILIFLPRPVR